MMDTPYQDIIYQSRYARWDYSAQRRERWPESIQRYISAMKAKVYSMNFSEEATKRLIGLLDEAHTAIAKQMVMPSMRAMWSAGQSLYLENASAFNCAYTTIERLEDFAEVFYLLMCGCGVSYSCERQFIVNLPQIPIVDMERGNPIVFEDSREGWAEGYLCIIKGLAQGIDSPYDVSKIRPKGSILKTFGGRASGPEPLVELIEFTKEIFMSCRGRRLNSEQVSDILCKIAESVVVGGVRRSATLALTNPSDRRMADYKTGNWHEINKQRALVNVSTAYTEKPDSIQYMDDMLSLVKSNSGERGIVNRENMIATMLQQGRIEVANDPEAIRCGVNPCGEIILRSKQFCNLSEIVVRDGDTLKELIDKTKIATALAFVQSLFTDYKFISKEWGENAKLDRILGVSMTGLRDHHLLGTVSTNSKTWLTGLRNIARDMDIELSKLCDIPRAKAITCVKPSGTVSQLVDSASGLHVRNSHYYIRRVRLSASDPICALLIDTGVPHKPENGETVENVSTWVFSFPMKAPQGATVKEEVNAISQLEYWLMLKEYWCDHNPSCTINVKEHEWPSVSAWVYEHFNRVGGISFMPEFHGYAQPPYETITREKYEQLVKELPPISLDNLWQYETEDYTTGSQELACSAGGCEI